MEAPKVKKGDKVKVQYLFYKGKPEYDVIAHFDSYFNETLNTETFSFLTGGDMMMIAKWNGEKWISD